LNDAGYDELLKLAQLVDYEGKVPVLSEAGLVQLEQIAADACMRPTEAQLDHLMSTFDALVWPSKTLIPNREAYLASIRWTLSQYPIHVGRKAPRIAVDKADRQAEEIRIKKECEALMKRDVVPVRKYLTEQRRQIENTKRSEESKARREQEAIEAAKRRAEADKVRQLAHHRQVRKLVSISNMPEELCDGALTEAERFGLRFDDIKSTEWIPEGIRFMCHVHRLGVEVTALIRDVVSRDFTTLKLGFTDRQELLTKAIKRVDAIAGRVEH
jgi:hypothetical protein